MRNIGTNEYITLLKSAVADGHEVSMPVSGNSMAPFVRNGRDRVYFKALDSPLKVGDIVFFQRKSGQYVLHRICAVKAGSYYIIGDAQNEIEGPIAENQIFAIVTKVERNGKIVRPGDLSWEFYAKIWSRAIKLRQPIRRIHSALK